MFPYGGVTLCDVSILRLLVDVVLLLMSLLYSILFYYCFDSLLFIAMFLFVESGVNRVFKGF